ncbi:MAG: hypothetical protein B9S38_01705 [Verrucomicrobiia bacterium Tous-C4TDCM]|nr:MAG: hypothetical protein B9S38_01705 [Verrucomicrobiae bacterium Tous-C4TDCM]
MAVPAGRCVRTLFKIAVGVETSINFFGDSVKVWVEILIRARKVPIRFRDCLNAIEHWRQLLKPSGIRFFCIIPVIKTLLSRACNHIQIQGFDHVVPAICQDFD